MIPIQHICGYAETCLVDYMETGAEGWNHCQLQGSNRTARRLSGLFLPGIVWPQDRYCIIDKSNMGDFYGL
jgi:hypothetical protein